MTKTTQRYGPTPDQRDRAAADPGDFAYDEFGGSKPARRIFKRKKARAVLKPDTYQGYKYYNPKRRDA